ncbi:hypothetical protein Pan44_28650 [Caulifigura coniformis]|uniref:Uncharacterized protein n=1 Tax=Caulifigura coniformis TaxID=2527983 RepID=A0A517SFE8_9PLAN|nr:hypothetical protein [Caulifigura coniformis]QDT54827.1 hypothetical protein Pan44_28650 [Caulifigura coniformis]
MRTTQTSPCCAAVAAIALLVHGPIALAQTAEPTAAATPAPPAAAESAPVVRPAEPPWELRPYKVAVEVTLASSPHLPHSLRQQFVAGLQSRLADDLGAMWNLTLVEASPAASMPVSRLVEQTAESARAQWLDHPAEKVLSLSVGNDRGEWSFAAREWDRASETLGPTSNGSAIDDRLAVGAAAAVVKAAFRALVQVDSAKGREVVVRLRAGELTPPDTSAAPLSPGNFLRPFVRAMNRKGELQKVQAVPWTLLRVETIDRSRADMLAFSVFPAPVAATKKRLESLAIEVRPTHPETVLQIVPRTSKGNPVAAARVEIVDRLSAPNDPEVDRTLLRTDREGRVTVPADPTPQVRYAIVHSGTGILARVPFCPGVDPVLVVEVNDDGPRLSAEGEVSLLEADLIELVARRKVLLLRAEAASKAGKVGEVRSLVAELKSLLTQPQFQQRIDLSRTTAVEGAREKKDQVAEARIRKMYAALGEASKTHLDDEKFQEVLKDLQDVAAIRAPDSGAPARKR